MMDSLYIDNIQLRPITEADIYNIIKWRNGEYVKKRFILQDPFTEENQKKWIRDVIGTGKAVQFIIHLIDEDLDIGTAYIRDLDKYDNAGEYGIFIGDNQHSERGVGVKVTTRMMKFAFEDLHLDKIMGQVKSDNSQSLGMCDRVGLIRVDRKEKNVDGKVIDLIIVEAVNPEVKK